MQIEYWDEARDGVLSELAMRHKLENRGYEVTRYVYPPGTWFPPHEHARDKIDGVLSGQFRLTLQGKAVVLQAGDCLTIPHGVVHAAEVVGNEPVISLDAVRVAERP